MGEPHGGFYKLSRKQTTTQFKVDSSVYREIFRTLAVWKIPKITGKWNITTALRGDS